MVSTATHFTPFDSQQRLSIRRFINRRENPFGLRFSISPDTLSLTNLVLNKLAELDDLRVSEHASSLSARQVKETLAEATEVLRKIERCTYFLVRSDARRQQTELRQKGAVIKLQLNALRRAYNVQAEASTSSESTKQKLKRLLYDSYQRIISDRSPIQLTEKRLQELETLYAGLPEHRERDRDLMLRAIGEYREARSNAPSVSPVPDLYEEANQRASQMYSMLIERYPEYISLILNDAWVRDLFVTQVIRDQLDPNVFFDHPLVAAFFRQAEALERSIVMAGDSVQVGASHLPEIRFKGTQIPVRDIPGYRQDFKNLHGWIAQGLEYTGEHCSLISLFDRENNENLPGYVYTKEEGLIPFNPRSWSRREEEEWKSFDPTQTEWWKQLPPYKIEEIEVEGPQDTGWRVEWIASFTGQDSQLDKTHAFQCMIIPTGPVQNGRVKVAYYPFGMFAYLYEGPFKLVKRMQKELHYLDHNLHEPERGFQAYQQVISEEQGRQAMSQLLRERQEAVQEADASAPPTFWLPQNNCATAVRRVACSIGSDYDIPLALPYQGIAGGITGMVIRILKLIPPLARLLLGAVGASAEDRKWDLTLDSTYTLRLYLQIKQEIDEIQCGRDRISRQRVPLVSL